MHRNAKKWLIGLAAALLLLPMGTAAALWMAPADEAQSTAQQKSAVCEGFVDADGNGVCDRCDGAVCASRGSGTCEGFVDADGDGVCDRCDGTQCGSGQSCVQQTERQSGHHEGHHGSGHHGTV